MTEQVKIIAETISAAGGEDRRSDSFAENFLYV